MKLQAAIWFSIRQLFLQGILCLGFYVPMPLIAQPETFEAKTWVAKLADEDDNKNLHLKELNNELSKLDSVSTFHALAELEKAGNKEGNYFKARFYCLSGMQIYYRNLVALDKVNKEIKTAFAQAMRNAY